jgi:hypothetical protein
VGWDRPCRTGAWSGTGTTLTDVGRRGGTLVEELLKRASTHAARADGRNDLRLRDLRRSFRTAVVVADFVVEWQALSSFVADGERLTVSRYIAEAGVVDRTAWRRIASFRELFPELGEDATPDDLERYRVVGDAAGELADVELSTLIA